MSTLAICQLFHPVLHGGVNDDAAAGHFLALHTYDKDYDDSPYSFLDFWTEKGSQMDEDNESAALKAMCDRLTQANVDAGTGPHGTIANIRELRSIPRVDIVETIELASGHTVAIKKTLWLSVFQRMLKKRYAAGPPRKRSRQD